MWVVDEGIGVLFSYHSINLFEFCSLHTYCKKFPLSAQKIKRTFDRGDVVILQPRQPGALGTFAGTAAGVAAGTVIADKITGRSESNSAPSDGVMPMGPCLYEEQQLLGCAQTQAELQICESFRQAWLDCKQKYNLK